MRAMQADVLTQCITQQLQRHATELKQQFEQQRPLSVARHFILDDFLPSEIAQSVHESFPQLKQMTRLSNYNKTNIKYIKLERSSQLIQNLTQAMQNEAVIRCIEAITGIPNQQRDPMPHAGGVTTIPQGGFIQPHLDNSHDVGKTLYRTLNLLYYVSPNWALENGGHLELWNEDVDFAVEIPCLFNRLVVMETTPRSWHSVNRVKSRAARCCVFNYYFSAQSPEPHEFSHATAFYPRPEQTLHRHLRTLIKRFKETASQFIR